MKDFTRSVEPIGSRSEIGQQPIDHVMPLGLAGNQYLCLVVEFDGFDSDQFHLFTHNAYLHPQMEPPLGEAFAAVDTLVVSVLSSVSYSIRTGWNSANPIVPTVILRGGGSGRATQLREESARARPWSPEHNGGAIGPGGSVPTGRHL